MADELQETPQEQYEALKAEIKHELKEEFSSAREKRKHRVLYTIGVFVLGGIIGFCGGVGVHSGHHFDRGHGQEQGHFQNWGHGDRNSQ